MCLGVPGRVVELAGEGLAAVDVLGVRRQVQCHLLEGDAPAPGDWVLIHMGFALERIDEERAQELVGLLRSAGGADA